jgi:histidyl-tRNA synthetase
MNYNKILRNSHFYGRLSDMTEKAPLSTEPYKGVRDFYPEDMAILNYIINTWKKVVTSYGYEEYSASVLEPAELYRAKSGEEIVNEQTYTFTDRGEREVTLRPEMTPTVARMIAARRRELTYPVRWYSIPNLFRYEKPQRGRLREHWQLNVDIFGVLSIEADVEIISIAANIMRAFGMKDADFEIRINSRALMRYITETVFTLSKEKAYTLAKLIDRKDKMTSEVFKTQSREIIEDPAQVQLFLELMNSRNIEELTRHLPHSTTDHLADIHAVIGRLNHLKISNVRFDQTLMRGFDYYTGIVFEVFDLHPQNRRSIFGGGRYDELLSLFSNREDQMPAFGFGAGDVTIKDLLTTYKLLPTELSPADIMLIPQTLLYFLIYNLLYFTFFLISHFSFKREVKTKSLWCYIAPFLRNCFS